MIKVNNIPLDDVKNNLYYLLFPDLTISTAITSCNEKVEFKVKVPIKLANEGNSYGMAASPSPNPFSKFIPKIWIPLNRGLPLKYPSIINR